MWLFLSHSSSKFVRRSFRKSFPNWRRISCLRQFASLIVATAVSLVIALQVYSFAILVRKMRGEVTENFPEPKKSEGRSSIRPGMIGMCGSLCVLHLGILNFGVTGDGRLASCSAGNNSVYRCCRNELTDYFSDEKTFPIAGSDAARDPFYLIQYRGRELNAYRQRGRSLRRKLRPDCCSNAIIRAERPMFRFRNVLSIAPVRLRSALSFFASRAHDEL